MKTRIERWKEMVAAGNPEAPAYLEKITAEANAEGKTQEMGEAADFLLSLAKAKTDSLRADIENHTLHQRMGSLTDVINLAYIAEHYFGKSRQWLYQRLKGQVVNGKPAAFKPQEEETFKAALNDIGLKIAAFTAAG
ncbi:MAG: DUF5053 domain-containing protein [Muribaculaceae bacterium]|nr:DUF5053 domain-containing protein [Muribaculaceae bacterium]